MVENYSIGIVFTCIYILNFIVLQNINLKIILIPLQLKNMINSLFASKPGSPKKFIRGMDKSRFGWKAVQDLYKRECRRGEDNICRMIPGLQKSFIERDPWTKLNVFPAKIMQVHNHGINMHTLYNIYGLANRHARQPRTTKILIEKL